MRTIRRGFLGLIGTLCVAAFPAAANSFKPTFNTTNKYPDKYVWITIYDLAKTTHMDYGCVNPSKAREWSSGAYAYGSYYYIRGEVKADKDCGGATLCDTTVQAHPLDESMYGVGGGYRIKGVAWTIHKNGDNCYWD
jgi:hypothetical protein